MSESYSIPKGWALPCIGDVAILLAGYGFPTEYQGQSEGDLPFFKVGDISEAWQRNDRTLTKAKHYLTFDEAANLRAKPLPAGSVVFAKIGAAISLNRRAILSQPSLIDNNCMGLAAQSELLDHTYLFYFTCTLRLGESSRASVVPSLRKSDVEPISFPLPPLAEQSRIVAKIEELFSDLDAGVAALKRAKANLKRYRASVLKAAVEGKLTEQWRAKHPATEPASALLARILKERRLKWEADQLAKFAAAKKEPPKYWKEKYVEPTPPDTTGLPELPDGWCWARFGQLAQFQNGRAFPSKEYATQGEKLLRPGNLFADGTVRWSEKNSRFMPAEWSATYPNYVVRGNELVMNLTAQSLADEFLGRICLTSPDESCLLNQRLARITPLDGLDKRFALYLLKSSIFRRFVNGLNTGSLIEHMFTSQLEMCCVPLPPLDEQKEIVQEVERRFSIVEGNDVQLDSNLARATRLRQSILKRAFEGKLVPQDPKDESASALLERLRTSRTHDEANGTAATSKRTRAKIKESSGEPRTRIRRRPSSQN